MSRPLRDVDPTSGESEAEGRPNASTLPRVSVIVIVEADPEPMTRILEEYATPLLDGGVDFEFVFVCGSGTFDRTDPVTGDERWSPNVRVLEVGQPANPSTMLKTAVEHCGGDVVITLPSSLRVEPDALPRLVRELVERDVDVVAARRWPRRDGWINRLQTRVCNGLVNLLTGAGLHDITCRVYALRRAVLSTIPLYGNYFRFLPVLAEREGYDVEEVEVGQHRGGGRTRVYRPRVYMGWFLDIFGIFFLIRFTQSPLRFFGLVGAWTGLAGAAILFVLFVQRILGQGIADRPMLLLGVLLVTLAVQFVALGLIGEIVVHYQVPETATYRMARTPHESPRDAR